jgi:hypothetical protein
VITSTTLPDHLELRPRLVVQARGQKRTVWLVIALSVVMVLAVIAVLFMAKIGAHGRSWQELPDAIAKKIARDPLDAAMNALALLVLLAQFGYVFLVQKRERLVLSRAGIEYHSPLPVWLQSLRRSWSVSWGQIRSARLHTKPYVRGPQAVALELDAGARTHTLHPWAWVDPANPPPAAGLAVLRQQQKMTSQEIAAAIEESPLMRYFAAAASHLPLRRDSNLGNVSFALEKNPSSLALVVAFFVLLGYAFADGLFLLHETYVDDPPYQAFVVFGAAVAGVGALWMYRSGVPIAESLLVALLAGGAAGAGAYPGTLRLNAVTDSEGLRTYEYQLTHGREFVPLSEGPPVLRFSGYHDYWSQFAAGSLHRFELRRGGLGFYQLNMEPIERELKNYYETRGRQ